MATAVIQRLRSSTVIKSMNSGLNLSSVRLATHRQYPTKQKNNPFVQRRTDLIKKLLLTLVQHERLQTTLHKAQQLKKYGDLLVTLSQRRRPPPDMDMIQNGFVLTEKEAKECMIVKRIVNRRNKKVFIPPKILSEEEYVARCKEESSNMVMGNKEALEKLYGPLKDRYKDKYGNFVRIVTITHPPHCPYPKMAYVELVDNDLDPIPDMPVIRDGKRVVYGSTHEDETAVVVS